MDKLTFLRPLSQHIIQSPATQWQYQGFGMLRIYPTDGDGVWSTRLNIWTPSLAIPGVSVVHDHAWDFTSLVVAGVLTNTRYLPDAAGKVYGWAYLKPGPGGGLLSPLGGLMGLTPHRVQMLVAGEWYKQKAKEIHHTSAMEGTVTINERHRITSADKVRVFWPEGGSWVSAEPRPATPAEIEHARREAMRWLEMAV